MYEIIASDGNEAAFLKKNDKLYFSWGPDMLGGSPLEKNLQGACEEEVAVFIERDGFILHTPPTPMEKLEDWEKTIPEYEKRYKKKHVSQAA
ncbi:MAG: hypothetical protein Q7S11_03735 [bacterium]|nr:hypothetical protein [bacterium]